MSGNNEQNLANQFLDHCWLTEANTSKRCHFCKALLNESYHTGDGATWICPACFKEHKIECNWTVNDWRLQGQEKYLIKAKLRKQPYTAPSLTWTHDHCEFCWATFSERDGDLHEGYCTSDDKHWICEQCFQDFKAMFQFTVH